MAKAKPDTTRLRDLPKAVQIEIKRAQAEMLLARVKRDELAAEIDEHRANIEKLKEG